MRRTLFGITSLCCAALLAVATSSEADNASTAQTDKAPRAYVLGASVSMGFNLFGRGHSPPMYALRQLGYERRDVIKKTVMTRGFKRHLRWLRKSLEEHPPTIIYALDLFHHDVRLLESLSDEDYRYIDDMIETLTSHDAPVLLGYVWTRFDNWAMVEEVNTYLDGKAAEHDNLILFDAPTFMQSVTTDTTSMTYDVNSVQITLDKKLGRKLLLDIVHPNNRGARLMANMTLARLAEHTAMDVTYYDVSDIARLDAKLEARR